MYINLSLWSCRIFPYTVITYRHWSTMILLYSSWLRKLRSVRMYIRRVWNSKPLIHQQHHSSLLPAGALWIRPVSLAQLSHFSTLRLLNYRLLLLVRSTSKILLRAPLQIVPLLECNSSIMDQQPTAQRLLTEGVIGSLVCAADTRRQKADACQGDSGGPLILERDKLNNKFSILGIISSGFGCATKTPGLYTRVASYLDYIESIVWPNNIVPPI